MPLACTHCRAARVKCDHGDPCSRCQELGLKCYTRKRKPYKKNRKKQKKRGAAATSAAAAAARPNKKTKAETAQEKESRGTSDAPVLPPGNTFFTQIVHDKCLAVLSKLPSSHFGLQCAVKILHALARAKANWYLMTAVSWLATTTGIGGAFTNRMTTNRRLEVGNFDLPSFLLRLHNEAVGIPHDWEDVSDRIMIASNSEHIGGCVCMSPRLDRLCCNLLPGFREKIVNPTVHSQEYAWRCILGSQVERFADNIIDILQHYETSVSGPFSRCIPNVTLVTEEGPVTGNCYITYWLGSHGLDMCEIHEFVPHDKVSPTALQALPGTELKDTDAANAMLSLIRA